MVRREKRIYLRREDFCSLAHKTRFSFSASSLRIRTQTHRKFFGHIKGEIMRVRLQKCTQYLHCVLKNEIAFTPGRGSGCQRCKHDNKRTCPSPICLWSHLFKQSHNPFFVWNNICSNTYSLSLSATRTKKIVSHTAVTENFRGNRPPPSGQLITCKLARCRI